MALLHTVNKSPFERDSLASCLRHVRKDSGILFIEDGIYALLKGTEPAAMLADAASEFRLFALGPDLDARGIDHDRIIEGVEVVDYLGFVDLVSEYDGVQSWL
ncbi:MAG TPA: sulfurtransferase complex subunit TusB [Gammaproteobacteria bacterium]